MGRRLAVPSSIEVHGERYCIDTLRARWLRIGDAPECTYLYFRKATAVTGVIDAKSGYVISEDGTIFEMMSDGSRHKKCEVPLIKHPNE